LSLKENSVIACRRKLSRGEKEKTHVEILKRGTLKQREFSLGRIRRALRKNAKISYSSGEYRRMGPEDSKGTEAGIESLEGGQKPNIDKERRRAIA